MGQRPDEIGIRATNAYSSDYAGASDDDDIDRDADDTAAQEESIAETRQHMSGTIAAIGDKLNPHALAQEAKDVAADATQHAKEAIPEIAGQVVDHAKDAVTGVIQHIKDTLPEVASDAAHHFVQGIIDEVKGAASGAVGSSKDAIGGAMNSAKGASMSIIDRIKQNPLPAAIAGVGIYMLFKGGQGTTKPTGPGVAYDPSGSYPVSSASYGGGQSSPGTLSSIGSAVSNTVSSATGKVGDVAGQVHDKAGDLVHQAQDKTSEIAGNVHDAAGAAVTQVQQKAQQSGDFLQQSLQGNPLAVGSIALAIGLAVGLAIPESAAEQSLMGETRDKLAQKAQDAAHSLTDKVTSVAQEAMGSVKDAAQQQGLTGQS